MRYSLAVAEPSLNGSATNRSRRQLRPLPVAQPPPRATEVQFADHTHRHQRALRIREHTPWCWQSARPIGMRIALGSRFGSLRRRRKRGALRRPVQHAPAACRQFAGQARRTDPRMGFTTKRRPAQCGRQYFRRGGIDHVVNSAVSGTCGNRVTGQNTLPAGSIARYPLRIQPHRPPCSKPPHSSKVEASKKAGASNRITWPRPKLACCHSTRSQPRRAG